MVTFVYVPREPDAREQPLLRIIVLPRREWTTLSNRSGPPLGTVVSERADRVYLAVLPSTNPYGATSPDGRRFARMMLSIDDVRRALTLRS